jgi:hypothetical protein
MKRTALVCFIFALCVTAARAGDAKGRVLLMIAEQNIGGPQRAWWASEIDLSVTEATVAQKLIEEGYDIVEPSAVSGVIKQDKAFRIVDISRGESVKLGQSAQAGYVVLGKAVASSGGRVPQSNMISCFGNITAKLIRVQDGKVLAYLNASGSSPHMEDVTGGTEALNNAARQLASQIAAKLAKEETGGAKQ